MLIPRNIIICLIFLTGSLHAQINPDSTYTYSQLNDSLTKARKVKDYSLLAESYFLLGKFEEQNFSKSDKSFEYYTNAKQYFDLNQDTLQSNIVDIAIAERYNSTGFYQESLDLYEKALKYFQEKGDTHEVAQILVKMSQVYEEKGDNEKRLMFLNNAASINESLKDSLLMMDILSEKAKSYEQLNELDSALIVAKALYTDSKKIQYQEGMSQGLFHVGNIHKLKSNYNTALRFLEQSLRHLPFKRFDEQRMNIYRLLSELYFNVNNHVKAYEYSERYASLNDSILTKQKIQSSNNLALKYQRNEKNSNIKLLQIEKEYAENRNEQQRRILTFLSIGILLLIGALYIIINFYRQKMASESIINQQNKEIDHQKIRVLEDNIKINSMRSMLEGQEIERERIAKDLHDSLGGLLSAIKLQFDLVSSKNNYIEDVPEYHSAQKMLDSAVKEVRSISQNLQPGALTKLGLIPALQDLFIRFDSEAYPDIDFQHYGVPEKLNTMTALSIYRIIQELLYNAIKHAKASEILIQINREGDELIIQFEDDGIGYDADNLKDRGMGLENINSRITYLKGEISIDSMPNEGTSIIIRVKYE